MNVLTTGTEDITIDSSQTVGSVGLQTVSTTSPAYTNQTVTYYSFRKKINFNLNLLISQFYIKNNIELLLT